MDRRDFVKNSALLGAGLTLTRPLFGADNVIGANERINLALIGCGGRGLSTILNCIKVNENITITAVCDVNRTKLAKAAKAVQAATGKAPKVTEEMRELFEDKSIDVAWISTPEHWHMLATIWACQAGKDVYVEKNPSINIFEGRQMVAAAKKYNRIVQVGFQNRSAPYGFTARDYIANGKLGNIVTVKCYNLLGGSKVTQKKTSASAPKWINWEKWLGPAPLIDFDPGVVTENSRGGWLNYWAYSGGGLADDASHVIDLARFVIGDPDHPTSVYGWGGNYAFGGTRETPEYQSVVYDFGKFTLSCDNAYATNYMSKTPPNIRMDKTKFPNWRLNSTRTEIYGTKGLMYLGRHGGGWQVIDGSDKVVASDGGVMPDNEHQQNFVQALRNRKGANGDPEQCHRSATLVHLGNIAYRTGNRQLFFDGKTEKFTNSDEANVLARGAYRKGYEVPENV
ncbi:MAG: Gfo/Idh/MocA family oxidoreductase [Puniceicoccales bacterium]|jgi:predicted dehydrogenase|nr:Gfo/Idh/MocA family oxidoreductase [Puniceicoccales bacterium]